MSRNTQPPAEYRRRALPIQLDRARRRYAALLNEARREGRFELLTPEELIDAR